MPFQTVLFDLDGTLTDSGPGIAASVRFALAELGLPPLNDSILRSFVGPPLADSFKEHCGLDDDGVRKAIAAYRRRFVDVGMFENSVYPGIPEVLKALADDGRRLAVATSKVAEFAITICDHFGLSHFFEAICGSDLAGTRVAKADMVADALAALGVSAGPDVVLVGDRSHDMVGARAVGIDFVGGGWGYGSTAELVGAGARQIAADVDELAGFLGITNLGLAVVNS